MASLASGAVVYGPFMRKLPFGSVRRELSSCITIRVWTAPIALGLFTALLSDDLGDVPGWLTLAVPVVVVLWYSWPRRRA